MPMYNHFKFLVLTSCAKKITQMYPNVVVAMLNIFVTEYQAVLQF